MALCECGCGNDAGVFTKTRNSRGQVKGKPRRFIHGHSGPGIRGVVADYVVEDRGFDTPCWTWQRAKNQKGYGLTKVGRSSCAAHRVTYERQHGPVPEGFELDHLCRNRDCVNPAHLEAVTHTENVRRGRAQRLSPAGLFLAWLMDATTSVPRAHIAEIVGVSKGRIGRVLSPAPRSR